MRFPWACQQFKRVLDDRQDSDIDTMYHNTGKESVE